MDKLTILSIVILVLVVLAFIAYILYQVKKKGLRQTAIDYICFAEKSFENHKNDEKFNYVLDRLYNGLPAIVRVFITTDMIKVFIQKVFNEIKIALDTQKIPVRED